MRWAGCIGGIRNGYKFCTKNVGVDEKVILKCIL
jgi:hypothetical protein